MTDLRKAAEQALKVLEEINEISKPPVGIPLPAEIDDAMETLRQALAPPVKTYCGGKPNYCTPVDAVNMSQECVYETAKGGHKWVAESKPTEKSGG